MKTYPLTGYMLLPPSPVQGYRGVDRNPFLPSLIEGEMDENAKPVAPHIWTFYPPGWRREAYRLYEEHLAPGQDDFDPVLISTSDVARQIQRIIQPHVGTHEIVACEVWSLESQPIVEAPTEPNFLGYDIAYLGGDFYSAVLNGLFVNPASALVHQYKTLITEFGLFPNSAPITAYVRDFKQAVPSEANSDFYIWGLWD